MPIHYTDPEMEILYDRLAAYARTIQSIYTVVKWSEYDWSSDVLELIDSKLEYNGVTKEDVGIDSNVGDYRIRAVAKGM